MELTVEKVFHLSEERARRLDELARSRGVIEETIISEALDTLFRQNDFPDERDSLICTS